MARIVPYNPFAFPPSMEVRCRRYDSREGGVRVAPGTATESNARTTHKDVGSADNAGAVICRLTWMC